MDDEFKASCVDNLNEFTNQVLAAMQTYQIIMLIKKLQESNVEILNISPAFYNNLINNSVSSLFVEVSKLYDDREKNYNLTIFLKNLKNKERNRLDFDKSISYSIQDSIDASKWDSKTFNNIIEYIDFAINEMEKQEIIINRVRTQRNKFYAHYDADKFEDLEGLKNLFNDYSVTFKDFETLLLLYFSICNGLHNYFRDTYVSPNVIGCDDFNRTIHFIKLGIEKENENLSLFKEGE